MKFHEYITYGLGVMARTYFLRTYARTEGRTGDNELWPRNRIKCKSHFYSFLVVGTLTVYLVDFITKCFCHCYDIHGKTASYIKCACFTICDPQGIAIQCFHSRRYSTIPYAKNQVWYFPGNN